MSIFSEYFSITASESLFKGDKLDVMLKEYGILRADGETDFNLRKRAYKELRATFPITADECILGRKQPEWDDGDTLLVKDLNRRYSEEIIDKFTLDLPAGRAALWAMISD